MLKRTLIVGVLLAAAATGAYAQVRGFVGVYGPITAGHCAKWLNADTIVDAGKVCGHGGGCSNKLDFSQSCNSQYIGVL